MATQTYAALTAEQKTFYDRVLLERLLPELVHGKWGQKKSAPKNEGDTINFRRFNSLAAATTPLTEGVTPTGNSLSITTITATVQQYGDYIEISDKISLVGIDPVLTETVQLLGEQSGLTFDTIVRDVLASGTNVQYAGGKTARNLITSSDIVTATEIKKAVRTLRRNNVKPIVNNAYIGIIHPDVEYDIMSDPAWIDVSKYAASEQIFDGEVGKLFGVKFVRTANAKKFPGAGSGGIDVYATLIIGRDAYGIVDIAGSSKPEVIVKPLGSAGSADPLNQRQTAGWKAMFTAVRLQELAILRLESAASA